jgi:hypothetical protein
MNYWAADHHNYNHMEIWNVYHTKYIKFENKDQLGRATFNKPTR